MYIEANLESIIIYSSKDEIYIKQLFLKPINFSQLDNVSLQSTKSYAKRNPKLDNKTAKADKAQQEFNLTGNFVTYLHCLLIAF